LPKSITNRQHLEIAHPCELVLAALKSHSLRLKQPLFLTCQQQGEGEGLPHVKFWPQQLQRFLRGCVAATAQRLVAPCGDQHVTKWTLSLWKNRIFLRVMSGFVKKVEVRLQGARFAPSRAALAHSLLFMFLNGD
jgi:hypothetical protein